jgi:hypothetical protein
MRSTRLIFAVVWVLAGVRAAQAQGVRQDLRQKFAAVKESVARNQAALHRYARTEHTDISLPGEVKKTADKLCRYGGGRQ